MKNVYLHVGVALVAIALLTLGAAAVQHYGEGRFQDGRNVVLASDARDTAKLQANRDALDHYSALATGTLTAALAAQLPALQGQTHANIETISTTYRDRPVADDPCSRPAGVQTVLNEAVTRANQAASGQL